MKSKVRTFATIGAAQAMLLAAAGAKADTAFSLIEHKSKATVTQTLDLHEIGAGIWTTSPQYPDPDGSGFITGSDTTTMYGIIYGDVNPGTFELLTGHVTWAANNTPGNGGVPGAYSPFDPIASDPAGVPGGTTFEANYGVTANNQFFDYYQVFRGLSGDFVTTAPGPRPWNSGTGAFPYVPGADSIVASDGRSAFASSGFGGDTRSLVGEPVIRFGTTGLAVPTWDPLDTTAAPWGTLRLPIESFFQMEIDLDHVLPGATGYLTVALNGEIIAAPLLVPEPAGIVLAVMGLVGLSVCRRLRRPARA